MITLFGSAVVGTFVARYLGPSRFGLLNYGLAIYALFNTISNLGLDFLVVRDIALNEEHEPHILGTAFVLKMAASVLTTVSAVVAARILEPHGTILLEIVALTSVAAISQAFDVVDFFFQARTQSRYSVTARISVFVAASIARLSAVLLHAPLIAFAWIAAIEILTIELALAASYAWVRRPWPRWKWHSPLARTFMSESWPLLVASLMITIYMRTDQIILGKMASPEVVGQYSVAVRLSQIWYAIPTIVCASVMPRILKSYASDRPKYYARLERLYESMILLGVVVAIGTQLAGPFVVKLLFGQQFAPAATILSIHIWTGVFVGVGVVSGQQLVQEHITINAMYRTVVGATVNVILNILLIPRWGGVGSALATLAAQASAAYFADLIFPRTHYIFRMKTKAYLRFWMLPRLLYQGSPS